MVRGWLLDSGARKLIFGCRSPRRLSFWGFDASPGFLGQIIEDAQSLICDEDRFKGFQRLNEEEADDWHGNGASRAILRSLKESQPTFS